MTDDLELGFIWHEHRQSLIFGMTDGLKLGFICHEQKPIFPAFDAGF